MRHFKVDNFYRDKDKILKTLFDYWEKGEKNTNYSKTVTDIGRSLSVLEIHDYTKLSKKKLKNWLFPSPTMVIFEC
jgi:hypothetical protein